MIFFGKNKGRHIPIYILFSILGTLTVAYFIEYLIGGHINDIKKEILAGIALIISGFWTYLAKDDYVTDKNGKKHKLDMENTMYFIQMEYWGYILVVLGLVILLSPLF